MEFPVDLLADFSQGEQERLSEEYMKSILCTNPDALQKVTLANRTQVPIGLTNVGFVPLYGTNDKQKVLALFSPSDQLTAVALYLRNRWWTVDEILKTGDTARDGILQVQTVGERIVLYTLNRVVYRAHEMSSEELPFLCHAETDYAKILWKSGEAVGFYSVKPPGSLCSVFSTQRYQLPVMDSIFVRKCHRGNGFGVQMLEDFVSSFRDDCLGVRYPVSKAMFKVCEMYLSQYPGDRDVLWEVEGVGSPKQRTNIANKIHTMNMSAVSRNLSFTEKSVVSSEVIETDVVMEEITSHNKSNESVEYTVQILEEVTLVRGAKEIEEIPVTTRVRSSGLKQRKMRQETEEVSSTPTPDTALLTTSEVPEIIEADMKQTLLDEEPQTPEATPEIPKLQRAMVVIVDLKASCHEPQVEEVQEITHIKLNIPAENKDDQVTSPTVETRALRSKTKAVADIPQRRRPLRERPEVDYVEANDDEIEEAAVIDSSNVSKSVGDEEDNKKTVEVDMDAALPEEALMSETDKEEMQCEQTDETAVTTLNEVPEQAEVGVSSSEEAEASVAETRSLRVRKKTVEATPTRKSTRHKQVEEKEATIESSNEMAEHVVETRVLRGSKPVAPRRESKRVHKQQKEAEVEENEQSTTAEDIKVQKEDETVETPAEIEEPKTDNETEGENTEQESGTPEDEGKDQEIEAEKEHTKEGEGEGVEAETPEVEPVTVEGEEQAEGVTQEPPLAEPATEESQDVAAVEMVEEEIVPSEEAEKVSPTPIPDLAMVTASETAPVSVEEEEQIGVQQQTPLAEPATEESQELSAVKRVEDEIGSNDETDKVTSTPIPDTDVVTPSEVSGNIDDSITQTPADVISLGEVAEQAEVGVSSSEEEEAPVTTKRKRGRPKKTVDATPQQKSTRQKQVEEKTDKEETAVETNSDKEEPVVETRVLRGGRKSAPVAPRRESKRVCKQLKEAADEEQEEPITDDEKKDKAAAAVVTKNDEEEPVVETRVLRRGRKSAPVAPRRESKRVQKGQKEAEVEKQEESTTAEEIKLQEDDAKVETKEPTTDKETEGENTEQELGTPADESEQPEIEAEKEHIKENEEETEKGEGVEAEIPEVEPAPVSVEGEEQVERVTQEPPLAEPATEESQDVAAVEMVEDKTVPSQEAEEVSPTPSPDSVIDTPSEPAPVSVEEEEKVGVTQDTPLAEPATEEAQVVAAVQMVEDEIENNDDTEVSSTPDKALVTPNKVPEKIEDCMTQPPADEEPPTADEEPQKEVTSQIPKLQRASVVLVDLKATCHDPHIEEVEETPIQQSVSAEKTDEEAAPSVVEEEVQAAPSVVEEEVQMEAAVTEEPMAETNTDQNQMTAVVETCENETVQNEDDGVSINVSSAVTALTEVPEQAKIEVNSSEEAESPAAATRTLRGRKKSVEATPTRTSTRHKQQEEDMEEPVVETRVLRRGRKSAPAEATPSPKSTRSKQQAEKKDKAAAAVATKNDEEEPVVETRVLRRGRKSAPVAPRRESKRVQKGQKEAEVKKQEESTTAEEIKLQEDDAKVETKEPTTDKETEGENTEQELGTPADESEQPEIEAEKEHIKENEEETEKGEGVEAEIPEVEPAPVSVEGEEQVERVTQEPPLAEPATEESQDVAAVEMVEDKTVPSQEAEEVSPTPSPDSVIDTPSEPAPVSVEEEEKVGVTQDTPLAEPATEEAQEVAAVQMVEDEIENNDDTEVSSTPDKALVTPNEVPEKIEDCMTQPPADEEPPTADEEPQKEVTSQIPKLQRASVVLVDLKATCHDPHIEEVEETPIQQSVSTEKTDEEAAPSVVEEEVQAAPSVVEEEVQMEAAVTEEPMAETNTDQNQMTAVVETCENETVQNEDDGVSINVSSAVTALTEVPEQAKIEVNSSEEAESPAAATRTLRGRKKSVEATPTRTSTRHKQQEEDMEEPVVETRVLRRGRKSAPAAATPSPKSTRSKQQAEKKDKEAAAVETNNIEEEPVVETRVLRRGRKSAPVAPRRESKRGRKGQKEAEDEEQEEPIAKVQKDDVTVERPEQRDEPKTDKEAEGENIEQESGTPEDESEVPEIEAEKEHTEENKLETETGEGVEVETPETEPAPVSVEEEEQVEGVTQEQESGTPEDESKEPELEAHKENTEENEVATEKGEGPEAETQITEVEPAPVSVEVEEQVEGVTQDTPLAETATEDSQEVSLGERADDEIVPIVEAEELSPTTDSSMVTPSEPAPESVEEEQVGVTQETPLAEPASKESQEVAAVESVEDEIANNEETDAAVVAPSEVPENIEDSMTQTPADEEPQKEVVAVESSNDDEEAVVETRVLRRGRKSAPVKSTPSRKSTRGNPEEKKDKDEPDVETRVLRRGRKSAPVAPKRESKRVRKQLKESEDEEQEEPLTKVQKDDVTVETPEETDEPKTDKEAEGENTEQESGTPEDESEEPEIEDIKVQEGDATVETPEEAKEPMAEKETEGANTEQESGTPEDESEEPELEDIKVQEGDATVETPEEAKEPMAEKETEGANTEQESGTHEDESEVTEIDAEKEHTEENELETDNGEGVEAETPETELVPVSAEEEEQVEGVTQETPLAEPATEESQEVAVGERLDDEMKQQRGEEEKEEEPVEAEIQEAEAPVVETQAPPSDVPEKTEPSVTQTPADEDPQRELTSQIPKLQRTTVVLVDLKSNTPHVENIDETTPETTRRSTRQRPEVDYDETGDDDIKEVPAEAVIDSNDEEDNATEHTANEETEKPEQEEASKGIDVTNRISGESEEDNVIKLALEEDEEEETAGEEGRDELAISKESPKVETRALQDRTKAEADTPKIKSKRRHHDEEEVEEVEPPKRRSTRHRPDVDYSEDGDIISPPVTLSSGAKPRRQSTKGKRAAREREESSSDDEQEKISPSDKRILRKRTSTDPTPVRRSKRAANISE